MGAQRRTRGRVSLGRGIGERLTYANVVATLALVVALGTGGAYAASQIGPKEIKKNAVRAKHIKASQVKAKHVAKSAIRTKHIKDGAVTEAKLAEGVEGLAGPKGEPGAQGPKGDAGADGADGAPAFSADCNEGLPADDVMVRVGSVCIDRYEASVWDARSGGSQLLSEAQIDAACPNDGQDCAGTIFARSVPGVEPARRITWFQAQQALINSGKRLPTNAEWQGAVSGTPDGAPCNVASAGPVNTGSAAGCVSDHGTNDMVGNVWEWVADWDEQSDDCGNWPAAFGSDITCFGDGTPSRFPGALIRGGVWVSGANAGPFAVSANARPSLSDFVIGFRGAR